MKYIGSQPFRGLHSPMAEEPKKEEPKPKVAPKSIEQKRMEVAKKHTPEKAAPRTDPWWEEDRPVVSEPPVEPPIDPLPPDDDLWGLDIGKTIADAGAGSTDPKNPYPPWEERTTNAVMDAALAVGDEYEVNVGEMTLMSTTGGHTDGIPNRVYFEDKGGFRWEAVWEPGEYYGEQGKWDIFPADVEED